MEGNAGRKYIEPTINEMFPIAMRRALRDPMLVNGFRGEN